MGSILGISDLPGTRHETVAVTSIVVAAGTDKEFALWRAPAACRISNIQVTWHDNVVGGADKFTSYINKLSAAGAAVFSFGSRTHVALNDETINVPRAIANPVYTDMVAGEVLAYKSDQIVAGATDPERVVQFDVQYL